MSGAIDVVKASWSRSFGHRMSHPMTIDDDDRRGDSAEGSVELSSAMHARRGPALGGACLGKSTDSSQTRSATRLPTRRSVHAEKSLRSNLEIAIALVTTKSFSKFDDVVDLRVRKGGDILPFREHADSAG